MIELIIAVLIGSILTGIALVSFGNSAGRFSVQGARNTLISLHARTRATAIERGETAKLFIDFSADTAAVVRADTIIARIDFMHEFNVDARSSSSTLTLCMSPRGYADESCTSFSSIQTIRMVLNADSTTLQLLPLGQLIY